MACASLYTMLFCFAAFAWSAVAEAQQCNPGAGLSCDGGLTLLQAELAVHKRIDATPALTQHESVRKAALTNGADTNDKYYWPYAKGHPRFYGKSPYSGSFSSFPCDLEASLKWSWQHPENKYNTIITGTPLIDDKSNIYLSTMQRLIKFTRDGSILWEYEANPKHREDYFMDTPALMNGNIYACTTGGDVHAVDMETGEVIWKKSVSPDGIADDQGFIIARHGRVLLDANVGGQHTPSQQNLEGKDVNGKIVCLNGTDGSLLWENRPDVGIWNFLPLFPQTSNEEDEGTIVFQSWSGSVYKVNLTNGQQIWRSGPPAPSTTFTDGGAGIGPNGAMYAVSCLEGTTFNCSRGGLHAYNTTDGTLLWENTHLWSGIFSYPVVTQLHEKGPLAVLVSVGPLSGEVVSGWGKKDSYPNTFYAFDAATGDELWKVDLPTYHGLMAVGDMEGVATRMKATPYRPISLPAASSYPTVDAKGVAYFTHLDGYIYAIKDWNNDGKIEKGTEMCSFNAGAAGNTMGPAIAPGLLAVPTMDTLYVFGKSSAKHHVLSIRVFSVTIAALFFFSGGV